VTDLASIAPAFVEMAHRIVWCTVATTDLQGRPSSRVLHPIWEWDGADLIGWIATSPESLKAKHLNATPAISLTYWATNHDTCTADCDVEWDVTPELRTAGWDRFKNGPAPVGYDPSIIPRWTSPDASSFGILRITPRRLRVMPGSFMLSGVGELMSWKR
jgi:Pyridoxamine 5'-phosphate oxidase